jgi:predicted flap endonuclease-1-like 5' DNA nuclease
MSPVLAFIIGLLVGWVIEWIIDWLYWRRKKPAVQPEGLEQCRSRVAALEQEISSYKSQLASLQAEKVRSESAPAVKAVDLPVERNVPVVQPAPVRDRLEEIQGITPEMAQRLNEAGINTFADLGALRPQKLKEILGGSIPQPGGEVEIVKQARLASGMIKKMDDLEVIVGIGPVIARTLNNAGIFTFADLGSLTAKDLREIVGVRIERLADEEKILSQARQLAETQDRGG